MSFGISCLRLCNRYTAGFASGTRISKIDTGEVIGTLNPVFKGRN